MDHSFVGMTGGEIFHEMMLRQGVKHICTTFFFSTLTFLFPLPIAVLATIPRT